MSQQNFRLALFASGNGTNAQAIYKAWQDGQLGRVTPAVLIADKDCPALHWAQESGLAAFLVKPRDYANRTAHEEAILRILHDQNIDLIALAGYMRLLTPLLVGSYRGRLLNIHPALLPEFPGTHAIERAYEAGVPFSGVTVHLVDEGMDTGPILAQEKVELFPSQSLEDFEAAIHRVEHQLYPATIAAYAQNLEETMQKTALLSVYDKTGLTAFAQGLTNLGYRLISSGGTCRHLQEAGLEVTEVSSLTKFPEMLGGRVKTLHPVVHGGILARRENPEDLASLEAQGIQTIDLVCVNLYPFAQVLAKGGEEAELIENIDIGGPTLLRAAAKNFRDVWVVTDPSDYENVLYQVQKAQGQEPYTPEVLAQRRLLAAKVFQSTFHYDQLISSYFQKATVMTDTDLTTAEMSDDQLFPDRIDIEGHRLQVLRYGENPHQRAAFYRWAEVSDSGLPAAKQLHGKELSYNNIQDANAALELLYEFDQPCVVALKHMNPCGLAVGNDIYQAWQAAYKADPVSIFGGIVAANREIDLQTAQELHEIFLEIVIAPSFSPEAFEVLSKKKNIRLLTLPMETKRSLDSLKVVSVMDGVLMQERDLRKVQREDCSLMTKAAPTDDEWDDLINGFSVVKHCKSNAIVVFKDGVTLGIGVGQSNRVGAAKLALEQAGDRAKGAILASDAFFPMPDTVEMAAQFGISAIIQPGGSIRDEDSIQVCNEKNIAMVATGIRHFKH